VDFEFSRRSREYAERLAAFMDEHIYPNEERFYAQLQEGDHWEEPALLEELKAKARAAGLWNLFLPDSRHGAGLSNLDYAPLCEMMGRVRWSPEDRLRSRPAMATWRPWSATARPSRSSSGWNRCWPGPSARPSP
jgi:alkylation response protein AidB-like acyl-CoA dehydrogenase